MTDKPFRSREEIEEYATVGPIMSEHLTLEVLLDIRDLPQSRPVVVSPIDIEKIGRGVAELSKEITQECDERFEEAVKAVRGKTGGNPTAQWLASVSGITYGRASELMELLVARVLRKENGTGRYKVAQRDA
jgi:hypothetical protein